MSLSPFDFLKTINLNKENIMIDDQTENMYNAYVINKSLSYFQDTIIQSNIMNRYHHLDKKLQYSFLLNMISKGKRFSKWEKPDVTEGLKAIKEYYGYSNEKARSALSLLSDDQLSELIKKVKKGGKK